MLGLVLDVPTSRNAPMQHLYGYAAIRIQQGIILAVVHHQPVGTAFKGQCGMIHPGHMA